MSIEWPEPTRKSDGSDQDKRTTQRARRAYPDQMTPELREVLGKLCFQLAPIAHVFRAAGEEIPEKAEDEQAFVLHWLIGLVLEHGAGWKDAASKHISQIKASLT